MTTNLVPLRELMASTARTVDQLGGDGRVELEGALLRYLSDKTGDQRWLDGAVTVLHPDEVPESDGADTAVEAGKRST